MSNDPKNQDPNCCDSRERGPNSERLLDVIVHTHDNKRAVFYRDLVQGKIVIINLMSIDYDETYPVTQNLAKLQPLLGERLGQDIFIYSISLDPEKDSPQRLKEFAERHGAKPGWKFLTGDSETIASLTTSLFGQAHCCLPVDPQAPKQDSPQTAAERAAAQDCSLGVIRYGNEPLGIWACVPVMADPLWIGERVSWVTPSKNPQAQKTTRRGGPAPLTQQHPVTARILGS